MKQYFLSAHTVQGVKKTFQGISLCCARDCSLHPVVYFLSVSLLWFIWLSVLQRDHNSAEKSWAKEPGENSRLVSHCWWQLTELFSSRTLCRVKSMKTLQQNPAFVGDDGQSTASTLPMSVSSPPPSPRSRANHESQVSVTTSTNRYILHISSRCQDNQRSRMATTRRASPGSQLDEVNATPGAEAWSSSCPA